MELQIKTTVPVANPVNREWQKYARTSAWENIYITPTKLPDPVGVCNNNWVDRHSVYTHNN